MSTPTLRWQRQIGTAAYDKAYSIATDQSGNIYIGGTTRGELEPGQQQGQEDIFVAKFDASGNQLWLHQIGTAQHDNANGIAADLLGNVFISGTTGEALVPGQFKGSRDAFLAKYDTGGARVWLHQIGTVAGDDATAITTDPSGNVLICGLTSGELVTGQNRGLTDIFLAKYDTAGNQLWIRQIGTASGDEAFSIATDPGGNIFISGFTGGELETGQAKGAGDAFLAKYDTAGNQLWIRQIGTTSDDAANGIATDASGNVFICGFTAGELETGQVQGGADAFLAKYDAAGNRVWLRQIGTTAPDVALAISTDASGSVFMSGYTEGELATGQHKGKTDAFLVKYDKDGNQVWLHQLGTSVEDEIRSIKTDNQGNIVITGFTRGELVSGQRQDEEDIFLAKYKDPTADDCCTRVENKLNLLLSLPGLLQQLQTTLAAGQPSNKPLLTWQRQIGTAELDKATGISTDPLGNIYISGTTRGDLERGQQQGLEDVFLAKYDAGGNQLWLHQIGTAQHDEATGIATDFLGNVFITGMTDEALESGQFKGKTDAFLAKYDTGGNQVWIRQLGTTNVDTANAIATDPAGNALICGYTFGELETGQKKGLADIFLAKYDTTGNQIWLHQIGTASGDEGYGIATDPAGNIFISGYTQADLVSGQDKGAGDAFLAKYDPAGAQVWIQQLGTTSADLARAIATDRQGNVLISGYTRGALEAGQHHGGADAYVAKYDSAGNQLWLRQIGTAEWDAAQSIATDYLGNVYISGYTGGNLASGQAKGLRDAFLAKYDKDGNQLWLQQFGTPYEEDALAIAADSRGAVLVAGFTRGELASGQRQDEEDIFIAKFGEDKSCCQHTLDNVNFLEQVMRMQQVQIDLILQKVNQLHP